VNTLAELIAYAKANPEDQLRLGGAASLSPAAAQGEGGREHVHVYECAPAVNARRPGAVIFDVPVLLPHVARAS
jgi:hypothetical protein